MFHHLNNNLVVIYMIYDVKDGLNIRGKLEFEKYLLCYFIQLLFGF
jgi:hypothetical protein